MRLLHALLLALALLACVQHGRADTISGAVGGAVDTAVDGVKSGASSAWRWTTDTAGDIGSWFSDLGCKVTDLVDNFDLAKCDGATEAVPCPAGCANELKKVRSSVAFSAALWPASRAPGGLDLTARCVSLQLSASCLKNMVENQSNSTAATAEVLACGLTLNGAAGFTSVAALLASTLALAFLL